MYITVISGSYGNGLADGVAGGPVWFLARDHVGVVAGGKHVRSWRQHTAFSFPRVGGGHPVHREYMQYSTKYRCTQWTESWTIEQRGPQSTQSAGPIRFPIFCSISIILLACLVAGRKPQCTVAGNILHYTYPLEYQICSSQPRQKSCWASSLRI